MSQKTEFEQGKDYQIIQPVRIRGKIVHGFKRGSTQLGFPTANVEPKAFQGIMNDAKEGVYIGWAQVLPLESECEAKRQAEAANDLATLAKLQPVDYGIHKTMLSLGKNVQFDAIHDTLEAYIHRKFSSDFYDHTIEIIICAYIRPQLSFDSLDSLIAAINADVNLGEVVLDTNPECSAFQNDPFFTHLS